MNASSVFLLVPLLGVALRADVLLRDTVVHSLRADSGRIVRVDVDNLVGSVEIVGSDRRDVVVTAVRRMRLAAASSQELARTEVRLITRILDGRAVLFVDAPWRVRFGTMGRRMGRFGFEVAYDLRVEVPADVDLAVRTREEGVVDVRGVRGDVALENVDGDVIAAGLRSTAYVGTVNGNVTASFDLPPGDACAFRTVNGSIDAEFPGSLEAVLAISSMQGSAYTEFPFSPIPHGPVALEEGEGWHRIRNSKYTRVAVGSKGPELRFETINGTITILKRQS